MRICLKLIMIISMLLIFCNFASASPILPPNDVLENYEIESDDLTILEQDDNSDNNIIGSLTLSLEEDFDKPTFSSGKNISGEAVEGCEIITLVYNVDSDDEVEMTYDNSQTIGPSAMYRETLKFAIGENYILIIVNDEGNYEARQFTINRKEKETKKKLETGYIDITNCADELQEDKKVNIFDNYIKDLNQESGFMCKHSIFLQNLLR